MIADTERLNQALGLSPIEFEPVNGPGAARFRVRTRMFGLPMEYLEEPFEWDEPRRFAVRRRPTSGPITCVDIVTELTPHPTGGTRVDLTMSMELRTSLAKPLAVLQMASALGRTARCLQGLDARLLRRETRLLDSGPPVVRAAAFERAVAALEPRSAEAADAARRLVEFLRSAPDADVAKVRPYALADAWGVDRSAVLDVCLAALPAGLLELRWELVCPSCRTGASRLPSLESLPPTGHCHLCDLSFEVELEQAVEAVFRPVPAVRSVPDQPFCIGGPRRTPHVLAQRLLTGEGTLQLRLPSESGRYRLFLRGGAVCHLELTDPAAGPAEIELRAREAELSSSKLVCRAGGAVTVRYEQAQPRHLKLERSAWANSAVTARDLALHPDFARSFASRLLRPGQSLRMGRTTLLFSDLTGSTALYAALGDAAAYALVEAHFTYLRERIARHGGVLIKTIGDAVFASFPSDAEAVQCAVAMLREWPRFQQEVPAAQEVFLKLGVHAGPCYAIRANGVFDYFGQTVNVAARLQALAGAGELVVADGVDLPPLPDVRCERFAATVKGVPGELSLVRLTCDVSAARAAG